MARFVAFLLLVGSATPALAGDVSLRLDAATGFSVRNNTGAVERLRVDEATGNISRNGALFVHTTGSGNLFVGDGAGNLGTTGAGGNVAFGQSALAANSTGLLNSAFGATALTNNTTGTRNTAIGFLALSANVGGGQNTSIGAFSMGYNTSGSRNSALGLTALNYNTTGSLNSAVGYRALYGNTTGNSNAALGDNTLMYSTNGSRNVAIGRNAGATLVTGSDNIFISNTGLAGDNGQIRIGTGGTHTGTTIAGISGATSAAGIAVLVNAGGKLGTTTSSARFKQDVRDMGDASDLLMRLRPVTFRYTEEAVGAEESKGTQYGLIAEEVAEVAPELVAPDLEGRPFSVKYHELPALLLNEVQVQRRTIAKLEARIAELEKRPLYTPAPEVAR
jgi:endosialidase-like protein